MHGLGIDLDLGDMRTGRKGEVDRIVVGVLVEAGLQHFERIIVRHIGGERDLRRRPSSDRCRRP